MSQQEFLEKFDAGYRFSEFERRSLIWGSDLEQVEEKEGDDHRWQREIRTILKAGDRNFAINWMRALTEFQENEYPWQPVEVQYRQWEEVVVKHEWYPIDGRGINESN